MALGDLVVDPPCVIGDLNPTGAQGTIKKVLAMFTDALDLVLTDVERHRTRVQPSGRPRSRRCSTETRRISF